MKLSAILLIIANLSLLTLQQEDNDKKFIEIAEWTLEAPFDDEDYTQWKTAGSAVHLNTTVSLTPAVPERYGLLYNINEMPAQNWIMEIEIEVGSSKDSFLGGDGIALYYLQQVPSKKTLK